MARKARSLVWPLIAAGLIFMLTALPTTAQTPDDGPRPGPGPGPGFGPGPFRGDPPAAGGMGLMLMEQDQDRDQLLMHLRLRDCEPRALGITMQGRWLMYVPGAPGFVNRGFPLQLHTGDPFLVVCSGVRPDVRLTEADSGTAVTLEAGDRLRVILESNPSTGYSWVVTPEPNAAVLTLVNDFTVPAVSDLLGASGYQVFDFSAAGAGTTTLHLAYQRTTTPAEAPAAEWSVTVTVQ